MSGHPIPDAALDDRLGIVGTAGSGKTYAAGTAVERILDRGGRVIIPDPLGVWYGLRLRADGKPSTYKVVIFGGPHGDLPINEHAGALIGEAVAGMAESAIIDLSEFGTKAAERRFMLAFLTALYRKASGEPVHLIFDEADMWAPERLLDKEGEAAKLLGMMETVVRRGRIKGFIPWTITQRPAVISKNVLSQADGLVAMKLTSSQDRKALGAWVEGQADADQWKAIYNALPTLDRGQGVLWLPARGILETVTFPGKRTFDSSRTPTRGETVTAATLEPLDLGALKERLATVEAETKANDPKLLRAELAKLQRELTNVKGHLANGLTHESPKEVERAHRTGYDQGWNVGHDAGLRDGARIYRKLLLKISDHLASASQFASELGTMMHNDENAPKRDYEMPDVKLPPAPKPAPVAQRTERRIPDPKAAGSSPAGRATASGDLTGPQRNLLASLSWWAAMGHDMPTRAQIAAVAGWKAKGSNLRNRLAELSSAGYVTYPTQGTVSLTDSGREVAPPADLDRTVPDAIREMLTEPQRRLFEALLDAGETVSRDQLAETIGWEPGGSNLRNRLSELSAMEIVTYPQRGYVELALWVKGA